MKTSLVVATALTLVSWACSVGADDQLCFDEDKQMIVRTRDCPHGCCKDGSCGSKGDCFAGLIIGIIVGSILCALCVCGIVGMVYYCNRRNHQSAVIVTHHQTVQPVGYPQQQPVPAYGIPVQYSNGQQYPPQGYGQMPPGQQYGQQYPQQGYGPIPPLVAPQDQCSAATVPQAPAQCTAAEMPPPQQQQQPCQPSAFP